MSHSGPRSKKQLTFSCGTNCATWDVKVPDPPTCADVAKKGMLLDGRLSLPMVNSNTASQPLIDANFDGLYTESAHLLIGHRSCSAGDPDGLWTEGTVFIKLLRFELVQEECYCRYTPTASTDTTMYNIGSCLCVVTVTKGVFKFVY